jgi:hypothetical protein
MTSYKNHVDKLIELIYLKHSVDDSNNLEFGDRCHLIGKEIYTLYGYQGLFSVICIVQENLIDMGYTDNYLVSLRELEFSFSGICDEFQA